MRKLKEDCFSVLLPGLLNSYSVIFFARNIKFGILLLIVSFFNPVAGLSGLIAAMIALFTSYLMGYSKELIRDGLYSFNALMVGIGLGTFYQVSSIFFLVLGFSALLTFIVTIVIAGWLGKNKLPFLSLPFLFTFWLLLLSTREFSQLGLSERNIYWINEMVSIGGKPLFDFFNVIEQLNLPIVISAYFHSLSAIFFQDNLIAGILIASGILYYSRIAFSLSLIGFFSAILFYHLTGTDLNKLNYYNLGANFIMASMAIGGFFTIPSAWSYLWVILLTPIITFFVLGTEAILHPYQLPVYSLPFSAVVIIFLYFLSFRLRIKKLFLTTVQYYSPEINLYTFRNNLERLRDNYYVPLSLPFWGEWMLSQGYEGGITHKGDWSKALDFMILDEQMKTYSDPGIVTEHYFSFNKPVLAVADGFVEEIIDQVEDNTIGQVNTEQNWGNTIVIRHNVGLYSKLSHLKAGSIKVKTGDWIQKGQWIANVGNSGRSPEPHLHFQMQSTPHVGARTLSYPMGHFMTRDANGYHLHNFEIPDEGKLVSNVLLTPLLQEAFRFQPGTRWKYSYSINDEAISEEIIECFTDEWNQSYLYAHKSKSIAYFINNGTLFYFTHYVGKKNDLLYHLYRGAYKVLLGYYHELILEDYFPLHFIKSNKFLWMQDFIAPFYISLKSKFKISPTYVDNIYQPFSIVLNSETGTQQNKKFNSEINYKLEIFNGRISRITGVGNIFKLEAVCQEL